MSNNSSMLGGSWWTFDLQLLEERILDILITCGLDNLKLKETRSIRLLVYNLAKILIFL